MRSVLVGLGVMLLAETAHAATFAVTSTNDTGPGSLREAITTANGTAGPHTIDITATGTIQLDSALPALAKTMSIVGPGAAKLTVRRSAAAGDFGIFEVNAPVEISALTISHGTSSMFHGGGITVTSGSLSLADSVLSDNAGAGLGASAIWSSAPLTIVRSTVSNNTGSFTIYATSDSTLTDTTIAGNSGTAIVFPPADKTLRIDRSTVSGNTGNGVGGLQLQGGSAVIANSTFSSNTGTTAGDFWTYSDTVSLSLLNVTAAGSSSPSLLFDHAATVTLRNTLLAGTGARCSLGDHTLTTEGHNLSSDGTCGLTATTDKPGTNPLLDTLADNGGATKTHRLLPGSPALNAGSNDAQSPTDQRGAPRIAALSADIGAFEAARPAAPTIGAATPGSTTATIAFTPPASNGDGAITGYTVMCSPGAVASGTASPVVVSGLTNGTKYSCTVAVSNPYGLGAPSASVEVTTLADAPDAGFADAGGGSFEVGGRDGGFGFAATPVGDDCGCRLVGGVGDPRLGIAAAAFVGLALVRRRRR